MSKAAYLEAYTHWLRTGQSGLAPSPLPHGILTGDVLSELCAIEQAMRAESGLSSWQYYDPAHYNPMMAALRAKHATDSAVIAEVSPPENE